MRLSATGRRSRFRDGDRLRERRHGGRCGSRVSWHVDATYLKVRGRWCYLYRAIDRHGNLIDAMLIAHRDTKAAKTFFRSARASMGFRPEWVTTDGHGCYPRAIRSVLGRTVRQRIGACLNNRLEQDHRGIKGRHEGQDPTQARLQEPRDRPPLLPRARRTPRSAPPSPPCQPDRLRLPLPRPLRQRRPHRARDHDIGMNDLHPVVQRGASGTRPDRTPSSKLLQTRSSR